jgi:hypothetical protein
VDHRALTSGVAVVVWLVIGSIGCGSPSGTDGASSGTAPTTVDVVAAATIDAFRSAVNDAPYLAGMKRLPATDIGQLVGDRPFVVRGTVTGVGRADRIPDVRPEPEGRDPLLLYGIDLIVTPAPAPPGDDRPLRGTGEIRVNLPLVTARASQDLSGVEYPELAAAVQHAPIGTEAIVLASTPSVVAGDRVRGSVAGQVFLVPAGSRTVVAIDQTAAAAVRDLSGDALVERVRRLAGGR